MTSAAAPEKVVQAAPVTVPAGMGRQGVVAGSFSVMVFTGVHHLTISNIWAMLPIMLTAGALCGWSIAWSYGRLFARYSLVTWLAYNGAHLAVFVALGITSFVAFEPVTTVAAIMARGGPVDDLIAHALPMTVVVTLVAAGAIGAILAKEWRDYLRLLLTVTLLMLFLGSNISVLGLVDFGGADLRPAFTFFALTFLLAAVFAGTFAILSERSD